MKVEGIIAVNFPIYAIGNWKPEKIQASTGFEPVTSYLVHVLDVFLRHKKVLQMAIKMY